MYLRVIGLLRANSRLAWALVVANLIIAATQFAEPVLFGRVIDALGAVRMAVDSSVWRTLLLLLFAWAGFSGFNIACSASVSFYSERLAHTRRYAMLTDYFEHALQLPLAFHGKTHSGRLIKVMLQGTDSLWRLWVGFLRDHMSGVVSLLVLIPLSLLMNRWLGVLLIFLSALFFALTVFVLRKSERLQRQVEEDYSALAEHASDTLGNIALVQSFTRVETEVSRLRDTVNRLLAAQIPLLSWWAIIFVFTRAATMITVLSIVILGVVLNLHHRASVGEIVTFTGFASMLIGRLEYTVRFVNRVSDEVPRVAKFFDILDTVPALRDRPGAVDPGRIRGQVTFRNVTFSYDSKQPAVEDLNFAADPGDTIALVGPTGAGKSTALALLHRAFDPQSGSVEIDGKDIRDLQLTALRRNIGVVFQESLLFNRSIAENLRVGKPDATEEAIRRAVERAQAVDFIKRGADGLNTLVGERGRRLSGGERQRLSIARAFLKDPPILILDEATNALDARTETRLLAALDELMKDRTTFVIAHRLSTIRNATRILVFERGRIVESGRFEELIARQGTFSKLAEDQFMTAREAPAKITVTYERTATG
jgi:ATP-binding cassette subfamily B protein